MELFPGVLPQSKNSSKHKGPFLCSLLWLKKSIIVTQEWKFFFSWARKSPGRVSSNGWEHFNESFCLKKDWKAWRPFQLELGKAVEFNEWTSNYLPWKRKETKVDWPCAWERKATVTAPSGSLASARWSHGLPFGSLVLSWGISWHCPEVKMALQYWLPGASGDRISLHKLRGQGPLGTLTPQLKSRKIHK